MKICGAILLALVLFFSVAFPVVVEAHWGAWGPIYVRLLLAACHRAAPSQRIVQFGTQLYSRSVELSVFPQCTGVDMLRIYSILFGVVMILNWQRAQRPMTLILYAGGLCVLWTANFCRNVIMGIGRYHAQGWTAVLVFCVFVAAALPMLLRGRAKPLADRGASA